MQKTILSVAIYASISGCASLPQFPPAGPQQKVAPVAANHNCVAFCTSEVSQATALEDITGNSGTVSGGSQSQSESQSATTTTDLEPVKKADP